jgi:hypothetical protein
MEQLRASQSNITSCSQQVSPTNFGLISASASNICPIHSVALVGLWLHNERLEAVIRSYRRFTLFRPLKRKRLTLIAAFWCGTPDDPSVVVCADSQETCGHYRVELKKIAPRNAGEYDLIVGGSGEIGDLIDELSEYRPADFDRYQVKNRKRDAAGAFHTYFAAYLPRMPGGSRCETSISRNWAFQKQDWVV